MASLSLVFDLLARDRASSEFRKVGDAAQTAGKHASGFGSGVSSAMKLAAGAIAAAGIGRAFTGFVKDAQESAKISRLTEAVVKSTSGAANITAQQVNSLATAISNKTAVDDEQVQSASNLLLTFTKVRNETGKGNDIFNRAAQAAIDMSVAMGTDANGAALQLGKALNDPVKGVSALSRAGVSFTAQQKEQIKTMVAAGDTLGAQKLILGEMQTQFGGAAAAAADPLERLKVIAGNLGEEIGGALLPHVGRFATFLTDRAIPAVSQLWGWLGQKLGPVFAEIIGGIRAFGAAWKYNDGDITSSGLPGFMERVGYYARQTFDYLKTSVIPTLVDFGGWIVRNRGWLSEAAGAVLAMVVAFKAFMFIKSVITAVAAFNAVLLANPIGLVIAALAALVAGLVIAYRHSETFRDIVDAAFRVVAATGKWLWENILKPYFTALWTLWSNVAKGFMSAWTGFIQPALKAFAAYATFMWNNILKPYFTALWNLWTAVAKGIAWAWTNIIRPAWSALQAGLSALWNNIVKPIFSGIGSAWSGMSRGLRTVFDSVIKPLFDTFGRVLSTIKTSFSTAVDFISRVWGGLTDALKRPVQFVVDTVWNNGLRKLWNNINDLWGGGDIGTFRFSSGGTLPISRRGQFADGGVLPGYTPGRDVHKFMSPTGGRLELSGGEAIMRPEFTRALGPANIEMLNRIARQQGEAGLRRALGDGPGAQRFAGGGIVSLPGWLNTALKFMPGGGTVRDIVNNLSDSGLGGGQWGTMLRGMAKKVASNLMDKAKSLFDGLMPGGGGGAGGTVGGGYQGMMARLRGAFPGLQLISGFRPGAITATGNRSYHSMGRAVDVPPRWDVFNWIARNFPNAKELIFSPANGRQIHNGRPHMYSGITRDMHWDHVHWAMKNGGIMPSYQTGTNYVPQTGPALLHRGERVVPAAQNATLGGPVDLSDATIEKLAVAMIRGADSVVGGALVAVHNRTAY